MKQPLVDILKTVAITGAIVGAGTMFLSQPHIPAFENTKTGLYRCVSHPDDPREEHITDTSDYTTVFMHWGTGSVTVFGEDVHTGNRFYMSFPHGYKGCTEYHEPAQESLTKRTQY